MTVKGNVLYNRKNKYEEINRFRKGDITQYLTSIDIEKIVRSGGYNVKILDGFICINLEFNPFGRNLTDMKAKRKEFKKQGKALLQTLTKKRSILLYVGCYKEGYEECYKCVTQNWMKNEYDYSVVE